MRIYDCALHALIKIYALVLSAFIKNNGDRAFFGFIVKTSVTFMRDDCNEIMELIYCVQKIEQRLLITYVSS